MGKLRALGIACIVLWATGLSVTSPLAAQTRPRPIAEWKQLYPVEAISARLPGERARAQPPKLNAAAQAQLEAIEAWLAESERRPTREQLRHRPHLQPHAMQVYARRRTLEILHADKTRHFVLEPGNGVNRSPVVDGDIDYFEMPRAPLLTLSTVRTDPYLLPSRGELNLPQTDKVAAQTASPLLSREMLGRLHRDGQLDFVNDLGFGYRLATPAAFAEAGIPAARQHEAFVAGFVGHEFQHHLATNQPNLEAPGPTSENAELHVRADGTLATETWQIVRLELVSLLLHEVPVAYVSQALPKMEELRRAPHRSITSFESHALKQLHAGDDLVAEDLSDKQIQMVGGIRATRQCLQCHDVPRGTLLGAFSYDLRKVKSSVRITEKFRDYDRAQQKEIELTRPIPQLALAEQAIRLVAQAPSSFQEEFSWDQRDNSTWFVLCEFTPPRTLWVNQQVVEIAELRLDVEANGLRGTRMEFRGLTGTWSLPESYRDPTWEKAHQPLESLWQQWQATPNRKPLQRRD